MKEVPNIISSKDLLYINELIKNNLIFLKKINSYKNMANNSDVKDYLDKIYNIYKEQYKVLLDILS